MSEHTKKTPAQADRAQKQRNYQLALLRLSTRAITRATIRARRSRPPGIPMRLYYQELHHRRTWANPGGPS